MTDIKRAIVKSYDAATHKAAVQIAGSLGVWLEGVRIATDIPAADVVVDRQCTVLFIDPSNQDDALVLTIQGELPSGDGAGAPAGNTVVSETSFGQAPNKGTNTQYSRRDHTHGSPADPVPSHAAAADPHSPYALTPVPYDAIVDGVGAGPGVLVGAITVVKDEVLLSDLETNGRVTHKSAFCNFLRIICRATGDTGFTMADTLPDVGQHSTFTDCAVLEANAGIAFDMGHALHGIRLVNFRVRNFTGQHVIKTTQPDHFITGLNLASINVAPTQEPILVDGQDAGGSFMIVDSQLNCLVPNTFNCVKIDKMAFLLIANTLVSDAVDATPSIKLDHTGGAYYLVNLNSNGTTLFDIPAASTGLTILTGCVAGQTLVTGTGKHEIRSCKQGANAVSDRYDAYNILRATDNTGAIGSLVINWAQVNAYIHRIQNYADFRRVTAPGNPPTSGPAQASRMYSRSIDGDNDGLFIKIKKAGVISEVQIA